MAKIKDEFVARGENAEKRLRSKSRRSFKKKTPKQQIIEKIAHLVQKKVLKQRGPEGRTPKSVVVLGNAQNILLQQGHEAETVTYLPITWAIPTERFSYDPPGDNWRESDTVFLTGVRVRFMVYYTGTYRIRMAVMQCHNHNLGLNFKPAAQQNAQAWSRPNQTWNIEWVKENTLLVPDGPFAVRNLVQTEPKSVGDPYGPTYANKGATAPPPNPVYMMETSDGTVFTADLNKGPTRPLQTLSVTSQEVANTKTSMAAGWKEVDWYVPIGKNYRFDHSSSSASHEPQWVVLFYYDCPAVIRPKKDEKITVAKIAQISVKVYYK